MQYLVLPDLAQTGSFLFSLASFFEFLLLSAATGSSVESSEDDAWLPGVDINGRLQVYMHVLYCLVRPS